MRHRAVIGALLFIGLGGVLGTTVFRADIAQATRLAQAVIIANPASDPVLVQETPKPFRAAVCTFFPSCHDTPDTFQVPSGNRLVIQEVTGAMSTSATTELTEAATIQLQDLSRTGPNGQPWFYSFVSDGGRYFNNGQGTIFTNWAFSEPTTIYVDEGATVKVTSNIPGPSNSLQGWYVTVSGYLIPTP